MPPATYRLLRVQRRRSRDGATQPATCTLEGVLKFDGQEAPHCVYNEQVAGNLARVLQVPVADGILASTGDGPAYASLLLESPGVPLPDVGGRRIGEVVAAYPEQAAALVVFDILTGNWDRGANMKAALVSPHIRLFQAFDHSHCLLGARPTDTESIAALGNGELIVERHPFYGRGDGRRVILWAERVAALPDYAIEGCCRMGRAFRAVTEDMQAQLADALIRRRRTITQIVAVAPIMAH